MKTYKIVSIMFALLCLFSCEQEQIFLYEENSGVYFDLNEDKLLEKSYSFFRNPGKEADTIYLNVNVIGNIMDRDRVFKAEVIPGELTNAPESSYEILDGVVPAGSYVGSLPVIVNRVPELEDGIYSIELKLISSDDFPLIDLAKSTYFISFTSLIAKPDNWDLYCSYFFGEKYSENWLLFIVEATGDPDIGVTMHPWFEAYINYGLSVEQSLLFLPDPIMASYSISVRVALREYNNTHAEPLKHNDGELVEMPKLN